MEKTFLKIKNWIRENPTEAILLGLILLIGTFLRLYKIADYMTFLGDEGRDVIIVRRLLVEGHPPLIGPGTSIGNMYLGPLYYYMMAPALLIAGFSPVGPAVQIALLGVATTFFVWFVAREWFPSTSSGPSVAGLVAAALYAIAPTIIIYSRSSWNPNIMPFFALLSIYSVWQVWSSSAKASEGQAKSYRWLIVLGISFAFVLQSHYLGLLLLPTLVIFWFLAIRPIWKDKKEKRNAVRFTLFASVIFLALMSPLVIFDVRHGWINFNAMKKFFSQRQETVSARPWNAIPKFYPLFEKVNTNLVAGRNEVAGKIVSFTIVASLFLLFLKKRNLLSASYLLLFSWLGFALLGLGLYRQEIYDHYYGFFFPVPFLLLGALGQEVWPRSNLGKGILALGFVALVGINLANNPLRYGPNKQLQRARDVAKKILQESSGARFNLAVIAERNYEDGYKYFLLSWRAPVVDIDAQHIDQTVTNQLFAVCELPTEKCNPTNSPKAEVARFGWTKIDGRWDTAGVVLYRLVHTK